MTYTKSEILEALTMPYEQFQTQFAAEAKRVWREQGDYLNGMAMIGYSNICKNQCLYCGMRAGNTAVPRFRLTPEEILQYAKPAREHGFNRLFLISGEDPKFGFDNLLRTVESTAAMGYQVSLACGEFSASQYAELKAAGAVEYAMKFEMSDPETFNRLNPSTDFQTRMTAIEAVQASGLKLASGNIIDYPGQTLEQLADDILLIAKLNVSWAPIVPYLPAANTPLAAEGKRGSVELALREIALVRLLLPTADITGGQPGEDMTKGFADEQGNLNALATGANLLFTDLLPKAMAADFLVVDHRTLLGLEHLQNMADRAGMTLRL